MKINELLMNIHNKEFNLERGLEVKKYLPMETKKAIAQGIIYDCTDDTDGHIKVDSVQQYMSYVRYMITMHTNLKYTDADYDKLCSTQYGDTTLLNAIINCFAPDAKECDRILKLMCGDLMQNNSIETSIAKVMNVLVESMNGITNNLNAKIGAIDMDSVDFAKMKKIMDRL